MRRVIQKLIFIIELIFNKFKKKRKTIWDL
jgi:hypothetical protein